MWRAFLLGHEEIDEPQYLINALTGRVQYLEGILGAPGPPKKGKRPTPFRERAFGATPENYFLWSASHLLLNSWYVSFPPDRQPRDQARYFALLSS